MGTFAGSSDGSNRKITVILAVALPLFVAIVVLVVGICLILRRQKRREEIALIEKGKRNILILSLENQKQIVS